MKEEHAPRLRWKTPEMVEIKMDAEIGSYQADDERDPMGPLFTAPANDAQV